VALDIFVNVPFGILALVVCAAKLPGSAQRASHVIDYAGILLLTISASALILFTSLGGTTFSWASTKSIGLLVVGLVTGVAFAFAERRSPEPVLAPRLFANRVFSSASAISFVVGFAMFGAMTFLPLYFQLVRGVSPTMSGIRLLPMMGGLLVASIVTGQLVSKGWKYRPFPIFGTAIMTIGLGLLGTLGVSTPSWTMSFYILILGAGIGLVMQVLVTAVQNAVDPADLGAATAGANFFRSIGGSFGTAVFGALYVNVLPHQLATGLASHTYTGKLLSPSLWNASTLKTVPLAELSVILHAIAGTIQMVYRWALPFGVLAVILSLTLPEVKLRTSLHQVADDIPMSNAEHFE
jgi:predicted MFS family arabinose efflux permease